MAIDSITTESFKTNFNRSDCSSWRSRLRRCPFTAVW